MKRVVIHEVAEAEWREAVEYYEQRSPGLGRWLVDEISRALDRIASVPRAFPRYKGKRVRKCVLSRFPYVVFFLEVGDVVWVTAIAHAKRHPDYWKNRLVDHP